jgi:voltage-gated potassium channel
MRSSAGSSNDANVGRLPPDGRRRIARWRRAALVWHHRASMPLPKPTLAMPVLATPLIRRVVWHVRRVGGQLDRRFFLSLAQGIVIFVAITAVAITLLEKSWTLESTFDSFNWGIATVLGQGDPGFVTSPGGRIISWLLILFGVAMLGMITGALVALVIDFLLKEGQGLGASGYRDHIVVCGWNATARDLIAELRGDDYQSKVVVLTEAEKNPGGPGVYFVRGDPTNAEDLGRAGIEEASAALVFPNDGSDDADMRSILAVMAIESVAPGVRTVAEVNNPRHEPHFRRAGVDELLVTSKIASHLLARSALYPGLSALVTDIVSGGEGSELYRITLPDEYCGLTIDALSARLRADHKATLLSVNRGGHAFVNPPSDFILDSGDDCIVVAQSLGTLAPLKMSDLHVAPRTASVVPSA